MANKDGLSGTEISMVVFSSGRWLVSGLLVLYFSIGGEVGGAWRAMLSEALCSVTFTFTWIATLKLGVVVVITDWEMSMMTWQQSLDNRGCVALRQRLCFGFGVIRDAV